MPTLTRRRFLRHGAAALLAAPFCDLLARPARAAGAGARRLLVLFSPNGTVHDHWRPAGGENDFRFPTGSILEPLSAFRDDLIVLDGLDFLSGDNHEGGMAAMLTAGGADSIDQHVADAIGGGARFRSLELGVQTSAWGGTVQTRMSYRGGQYVTPDDDPQSVWRRLFGDLGDEALLQRRQSVLDIGRDELGDLRARLGAAERARLDDHLEALRAVERGLQGDGRCEDTPDPGALGVYDNDAFPDVARAQLDLAVQALACGATRVASVQLSHTVGPPVFTWLGETRDHHALSHISDSDPDGVDAFASCERWFMEQFAHVLGQLDALEDPETGAPLLESTLVLWAKELGDGRLHTCVDVPWVLAGSAGGFFTTGRYHRLGGATHDAVLTSICQAMGLPDATFGPGTSGALEVLR